MASWTRSTLAATRRVLRGARHHDLTSRAAETAFFVTLALLPAVLTLVAVLQAARPALGADAAPHVSANLARLLRVVLTARGQVAADSADALLLSPDHGLLGVGTLVALFILTRGMRSIQRTLTVISAVPAPEPHREWVNATLLSATVLVLGSVLLAAFTLGPLLGHTPDVGGPTTATVLHASWVWARWPISALVIFLFATLLLSQGRQHRPQRWRDNTPGAALSVLGWSAATALLPAYVATATHFGATLGSLGGGLIVLTWVYLMTLSLYLGAELNTTHPAHNHTPRESLTCRAASVHTDVRYRRPPIGISSGQVTLHPLPDNGFDVSVQLSCRVDTKARICVRQSYYSVPARLAGRRVQVSLGALALVVRADGIVVAEHTRALGRGSESLLLDHYLEVLTRKPGALAGATALVAARTSGTFTDVHQQFWDAARARLGDGPGTRALIGVLLLHRTLSAAQVQTGMRAGLLLGRLDADLVAVEARRAEHINRSAPAPIEVPAGAATVLRAVPSLASYDDLLTPTSTHPDPLPDQEIPA